MIGAMAMKRVLSLIGVCCLMGMVWAKPVPAARFRYVDLQSKANQKLADDSEGLAGNNLRELRPGVHAFGGINFLVGEGLLQLGSRVMTKMPSKIEGITVDGSFAKAHILHATCYGGGPNQKGS